MFSSFTRKMSINTKSIIIEKLGKIVTIGINRPDVRNCLNSQTASQLQSALNDFQDDNSVYAAVLHGVGGNFCSGFDLKELSSTELANKGDGNVTGNISLGFNLKYVTKPVVAALSGYAVAGGLELALLCDLRVMEDTAVVGLYGRRFGIPLVDGGTVRLQAMIGLSRALDLILTGRSLNAKEAFEWGLANRIVACGTGLGQAIQLATSLVKFPQECLISDRDATYNAAFSQVFDELLKYEKENAKKLSVKNIIEGAKRFIEGAGRHGKTYNLTQREISEWEKEFDQITPKSKL